MAFMRVATLISLLMLSGFVQGQGIKAFVKGSFDEIQQRYAGQTYLILFWAQDCTYCMKQLTILAPILKKNADIKLITVATDPFLDETFIQQKMAEFDLKQAEHWAFANSSPEILYFDVEKRWRGELPLTYLSNGDTLVRKSGLLKPTDIAHWLALLK